MRVLLIEDNARLSEALVRGLTEEGFHVVWANTAALGLAHLMEPEVDVAIVDLGLPDMDGIRIVQDARAANVLVPVLILTARDAVASRVEGLEAGADDYMVKPFAYPELLARLRALVRRSAFQPRAAPFSDLSLVRDAPRALVRGQAVTLSPREYALLGLFLQRRGEVLSRGEILREVFGYDFNPGTNIVEVHIAHLRRKLGSAASLVQTIRGSGYVLNMPEPDGT